MVAGVATVTAGAVTDRDAPAGAPGPQASESA